MSSPITGSSVSVSPSSYQPPFSVARRRHLLNQEKEYVLLSARIDDVKIPWGGETIVVPGRGKVILPHPKYPDVRHSYVNPDTGKLVPGTVVIRDIVHIGALQERETKWDAASLIVNKIGENYEGEYGKRGVAWVEIGTTRETMMEVFREAKARFEESVVHDSQLILWERQQVEKKYADAKLPVPPMPGYVAQAVAIVKKAAEIQQRTVQQLLDDVGAETAISSSFELGQEVEMPGGIAPNKLSDLVEEGLGGDEREGEGEGVTTSSEPPPPPGSDISGARATPEEQEEIRRAAVAHAQSLLHENSEKVEGLAAAPNRPADPAIGARAPRKKGGR